MNGEPTVVTHSNIPSLGTVEFDAWLKNWHTKFNSPEAMDARAAEQTVVKLTKKGHTALAKPQAI